MTRAGILVVCTACSFHAPSLSSSEDAPNGGQVGDRDADGIADDVDLCPADADPLQQDHDRDGHGDVCDRCPALPSEQDPDQDGDGVGDACDPSPAMAGDARVLWIGFYPEDAAQIADTARWGQLGAWSIADGWARVTAGGINVLRSTATAQRAAVATRLRLDAFSSSSAAAGIVSGLVGPSGSVTQFYQCALFKASPRLGGRSFVSGSLYQDLSTPWPDAVVDGLTVDLAARFANSFECASAAPPRTVQTIRSSTTGNFEFIVQDATVSFDYLFVVEPGS